MLAGKIDFQNDMKSNIQTYLAKISFTDEEFVGNFSTFMETINSKRNERFKGKFYLAAYLKSSEGPAFQLHPDLIDPRNHHYFMHNLKKYYDFDLQSFLDEPEPQEQPQDQDAD